MAGSENWYQIGEVIRNDYKVVQKEEHQAAYAGHTSSPAARVAESGKEGGRWRMATQCWNLDAPMGA